MLSYKIYVVYANNYALCQKPLIDSFINYRNNPSLDNLLLMRDAAKMVFEIVDKSAKVKISCAYDLIHNQFYDILLVICAGKSPIYSETAGEERPCEQACRNRV